MALEIIMPKAGMAMEEGRIVRWLKQVGDRILAGEGIMEIETDKIVMENEAPADGVLLVKLYNDGDVVPVTTVIGYIGEEGETAPETAAATKGGAQISGSGASLDIPRQDTVFAPPAPAARKAGHVPATPYARKLAKETGVDIESVKPGGAGGIVKSKDVELSLNPLHPSAVKPLAGARGAIARHMLKSHLEIPPVTQHMKAYVDEILALREKINKDRERKITINDMVVKACAIAVAESDLFRTEINPQKQELITRLETNIGVAVSLEDGLLVPVVFNADALCLSKLSEKIKDLAARARSGSLRPDECKSSVFTVSNMGAFGVYAFTPMINQPNAAIMGVNCINDELALVDGRVVPRKYLMLSLTFDHRIIDGAGACGFQNRVRYLLENPAEMLVDDNIITI